MLCAWAWAEGEAEGERKGEADSAEQGAWCGPRSQAPGSWPEPKADS